jgi:hypothetical protein
VFLRLSGKISFCYKKNDSASNLGERGAIDTLFMLRIVQQKTNAGPNLNDYGKLHAGVIYREDLGQARAKPGKFVGLAQEKTSPEVLACLHIRKPVRGSDNTQRQMLQAMVADYLAQILKAFAVGKVEGNKYQLGSKLPRHQELLGLLAIANCMAYEARGHGTQSRAENYLVINVFIY